MDPVGLAGTLIAIVQVSSKIVVACYEYHQSVKDALSDVTRIRDEATSVRNVAERLVENEKAKFLQSLQAPSQESKLQEEFMKGVSGTGEWLINHHAYTQWKQEPNKLLWVHGMLIDGLDECEDPDDLETIISSLTWLLDDTVHLIIFSRHLERLQLALEDVAMTQVAIEGEHIARDMRIALKAQLSAQRRFARWPASLKRDVESALLAEAQGW
ncbi:hypothetical protein ACHAQA_003773 [Verticillium albo-atrum]